MGRSFTGVLVVIALVVGIALIDDGRERGTAARIAAVPVGETDASPAADAGASGPETSAFGGASLTDCLGELRADPPAESEFPGLDSGGVEEIAGRVESIRGLRFDGPVNASFLDAEELDARIRDLSGGDTGRELADQQGTALELLGAIPEGSDLLELTTDTLTDQVVGLYLPGSKELLVGSSDSPGVIEEITLAHELEHALADADLGLPLSGRVPAGEGDSALAALALIEGDATLTMQLYALRYISLGDQLGILDGPAAASSGLGDLPDFLRRQVLFPYEAGLQYVCERYEEGGWEAVDKAYDDPPASTAELLGLRQSDPVEPPPAGSLESPWRPVLRDELGAASLAWLFAAPGGDPDNALPNPSGAIAGWAGDSATLWQDGEESALSLVIVDEGGTLCGATIAWYAAANPDAELVRDGETTTFTADDQAAAMVCGEGTVRLGIAPTAETAAALTQ